MKINDRFSIEREANCWIVQETRPGISRTGKTVFREDVNYYSQLDRACAAVVDASAGIACQEARSIVAAIQEAKAEIVKALSMDVLN